MAISATCITTRATSREALESHQRAAAIARALLAETPDAITAKRDLVMMLARVGGGLIELRRHDDAIRATEESIAIEEEMVKADPQNVQFQFDLADMYGNLAVSQRETRRLDEALRSIEHSLQISERAAAKNPDFLAHRFNYAGALRQLGLIQRRSRRHRRGDPGLPPEHRGLRESPCRSARSEAVAGRDRRPRPGARRSGQAHGRSPAQSKEARATLQQALDGWQAYQKGAGAKEDLRKEIDAMTVALAKLDPSAGARKD